MARRLARGPKVLWSRARKRSETLPLLTKAKAVETLMYLCLPPVVGRLLANQVLQIMLHA